MPDVNGCDATLAIRGQQSTSNVTLLPFYSSSDIESNPEYTAPFTSTDATTTMTNTGITPATTISTRPTTAPIRVSSSSSSTPSSHQHHPPAPMARSAPTLLVTSTINPNSNVHLHAGEETDIRVEAGIGVNFRSQSPMDSHLLAKDRGCESPPEFASTAISTARSPLASSTLSSKLYSLSSTQTLYSSTLSQKDTDSTIQPSNCSRGTTDPYCNCNSCILLRRGLQQQQQDHITRIRHQFNPTNTSTQDSAYDSFNSVSTLNMSSISTATSPTRYSTLTSMQGNKLYSSPQQSISTPSSTASTFLGSTATSTLEMVPPLTMPARIPVAPGLSTILDKSRPVGGGGFQTRTGIFHSDVDMNDSTRDDCDKIITGIGDDLIKDDTINLPVTTTTTTSPPATSLPPHINPRSILELNRNVPIIAVTSRASPVHREFYLSIGIDAVFAKPVVDPRGFIDVVKGFLREGR
ncbi:hypothetical protein HDU76_013869 [Blyttiomyces sp. JEL0837]|nr:hypothetical protein HDU76_013869 [Blyttiomyces sp. JEL0837]